ILSRLADLDLIGDAFLGGHDSPWPAMIGEADALCTVCDLPNLLLAIRPGIARVWSHRLNLAKLDLKCVSSRGASRACARSTRYRGLLAQAQVDHRRAVRTAGRTGRAAGAE